MANHGGIPNNTARNISYGTLSVGVTNLLHKSSLNRTWAITPQLQKLLSEISGCDTLSLAEGRGEATNWLSNFSSKTTLINGRKNCGQHRFPQSDRNFWRVYHKKLDEFRTLSSLSCFFKGREGWGLVTLLLFHLR